MERNQANTYLGPSEVLPNFIENPTPAQSDSESPQFAYNEAGAMMDAIQPHSAAELARVMTEAGLKREHHLLLFVH